MVLGIVAIVRAFTFGKVGKKLISRNRNAGHTTGRIAFFCRTIRRFDTDAESCDFFFMPPRIAGKIRYETKDATED